MTPRILRVSPLGIVLLLCTNCGDNSEAVEGLQPLTTLTASVSNLALATSGVSRTITITNTGDLTAKDLSITYPGWPAGTTANSNCPATLAPASSCTITVTPGANATSSCNTLGIAPTPGTVFIEAANASTLTTDVRILSYACIYQGGFLFAIDDTTPASGSIGGKVLTQSDQAAPYNGTGPQASSIIWSSNGNSGEEALDPIFGTSLNSTISDPQPNFGNVTGQSACDAATDGQCNSTNISVFYQTAAPGAPINPSYYATGLCRQSISGYSDWYLPAICEMGPDSNGNGCSIGTEDILTNLSPLIGDPNSGSPETSCPLLENCLAGYYWSSTQASAVASSFAWTEYFASGGGTNAIQASKDAALGVRCVRKLEL